MIGLIDASDSLQMTKGYACRRCSLLPPPPLFTLGPPPNVFAIELHCSSPSLLSASMKSSIRISSSPSSSSSTPSSSSSISIILGILIAFLIFTSTSVLIKKFLAYRYKQKQRRRGHNEQNHRNHKTTSNESTMISSSSLRYDRHDHHHRQNWTKLIPLLSESCSSDQTASTPPNDYPSSTAAIEPLLSHDLQHEYEQIKCDDSLSGSLHYYCLIYCRQCANYHPTSSSSSSSSSICPRTNLLRPCYLPLSTTNPMCQHQCACHHRTYHQRNDNRFFEHHQPMLLSRQDHHLIDELHPPLNFIEEMPPTSPT